MTEKSGPPGGRESHPSRKRQAAVEVTHRETEYIDWLSKNRIPIVVKLVGGDEVRGWIEYYDRDIVRLTRQGSNLFIYKDRIKYLYEEPPPGKRRRS